MRNIFDSFGRVPAFLRRGGEQGHCVLAQREALWSAELTTILLARFHRNTVTSPKCAFPPSAATFTTYQYTDSGNRPSCRGQSPR
jgi:hypothetical protein